MLLAELATAQGMIQELKGDKSYHHMWAWLAITSRFENVPLLTSEVGVSS